MAVDEHLVLVVVGGAWKRDGVDGQLREEAEAMKHWKISSKAMRLIEIC